MSMEVFLVNPTVFLIKLILTSIVYCNSAEQFGVFKIGYEFCLLLCLQNNIAILNSVLKFSLFLIKPKKVFLFQHYILWASKSVELHKRARNLCAKKSLKKRLLYVRLYRVSTLLDANIFCQLCKKNLS